MKRKPYPSDLTDAQWGSHGTLTRSWSAVNRDLSTPTDKLNTRLTNFEQVCARAILAPLIPVAKSGGRPQQVNVREVINAIFYILCGGCTWRMMSHEFPASKTVYHYFRLWRLVGVWQQMNQTLQQRVRRRVGRESTPSAAIVDSQSVKTTEVAQKVGYDGAKRESKYRISLVRARICESSVPLYMTS